MSTGLVPLNLGESVSSSLVRSDEAFKELSSSDFLPRLQLTQGLSELVTDGKCMPGVWVLVLSQDEFINFEKEVDVIVLEWRFKAMTTSKPIRSYYDPNSSDFRDIASRAKTPNSQCMAGIEFLCYLPSQDKFCTYFAASKSAKMEAQKIKPAAGSATIVTFGVGKGDNGVNKWHTPTTRECATQHALPAVEQILPVVKEFLNPSESAPSNQQAAGGGRAQ